MKEDRELNVMFNKSGGNTSKNSYSPKVSIPKSWLDDMGVTLDERGIIASYEDKKITIKKEEK